VPIQIVPSAQQSDPFLRQLAAVQSIGSHLGQLGGTLRELQQQQALVDLLRGKSGTMTPGQLDPTQMTPGSGAGQLGTPPTRGLMPELDEQQALAIALNPAMAADVVAMGLERAYPEPISPYEQAKLDIARSGVDVHRMKAQQPDLSTSEKEARALGYDLSTPEGQANYQAFRQGLTRPPAGTTIKNYGAPPAGMAYEFDAAGNPTRLVEIPGGPVERERLAGEAQAASRQAGAERQLRTVSRETDRILEVIEDPDWTSGVVAYGMAKAPGTDAYQAQRSIDTLGAIISFDTLNRMRAESPTGAGLGSITEGELALLKSVHGSLDLAQDPAVLAENLRIFEQELDAIVNGTASPAAETSAAPPQQTVTLGSGERTAVNPQTGERLVLRNGQWVPM